MNSVEIIVVGREILTGRTLDTNSNWLAKRITALGGDIKRIVVVDDEVASLGVPQCFREAAIGLDEGNPCPPRLFRCLYGDGLPSMGLGLFPFPCFEGNRSLRFEGNDGIDSQFGGLLNDELHPFLIGQGLLIGNCFLNLQRI